MHATIKTILRAAIAASVLAVANTALADEPLRVTIKDNRFYPLRLEVPANVKFQLTVKNESVAPSEFESVELDREKVVMPGQEIVVFLGPLSHGEYTYFDDFHQDARGVLVAK